MNVKCLLSAVFFSLSFLQGNAFVVQGVALLSSASDHSGVTVNFIPKSQSALAAAGVTIVDGSFSVIVVAGLYDIKYSKTGYQELLFVDQFISSDLTLSQVTLSSKPVVHITGDVQGNWTNTNTYMIDGNISIPSGSELAIEKGTTIQFSGFYQLDIQGKLTAIGTEEERIVFTTTKTSKTRGDWAGIFARTTSDTTRFDFCQIEYAASKIAETSIVNNTGNVKITNSIIKGSAYGGVSNGSGGYLKIENSEITDIYFYGIISTSSAKGGIILNNEIHGIDLIGLSCQWSISLVKGNQVYNTGYTAIQSWGNLTIEGNLLYNSPYGVFVVSDKPTIKNNTIYKNNQGIGFYDSDFWHPSAIITSNIIFHNNNYGIYCEGIYGPDKVEYNLISENPSGVANRGPVGLGVKVNTNIYGHQADTYLNIFDAPDFFSVDSQNENFLYLLPSSAAIDAGDPQFKDPDNSISDCGAIPFQKYNQTIAFEELTPKVFGDPDFDLAALASSSLPVKFESSNEEIAIVDGNAVKIVGGGKVNIVARQVGNSNYKPAPDVSRELTIDKATQTITFTSLTAKTFGDTQFTLSATATSNLPVSYSSSDETVATISGNTVTIIRAGSTIITAKQAGNANYNAAIDVTQTLTVNKADQTITFTSLPAKTFGDAAFTLSATTNSGLSISYTSSDETVATISGNAITIVGAGTTDVIAKQSGNGNYNAAVDATQVLMVSKAGQTVTFAEISTKTLGDAPFNLTATSTSGLTVQYASASDKISLSGNQVTLNKPGSVTIKADQIGNTNFNAASPVSQSFCINPAKPTITTTGLNSGAPVLTSSSITGNQWYKNGVLVADAVLNIFSPTSDGAYTVRVMVDNCSSELSAEQILIITGDISTSVSSFLIYPNPVKDNLQINLSSFEPNFDVEIVIYDISGKVMDKITKQGERATVYVGLYSLGTYFIKASQLSQTYVAKFAKE